MKKKIKLDDLKLESFLTELNDEKSKEIIGGKMAPVARTDSHGCCAPTHFECPPETAHCEPYVSYTCV